ncbi:hypothetical protein ACUY3M_00825 [Corynebacterium suicordis]
MKPQVQHQARLSNLKCVAAAAAIAFTLAGCSSDSDSEQVAEQTSTTTVLETSGSAPSSASETQGAKPQPTKGGNAPATTSSMETMAPGGAGQGGSGDLAVNPSQVGGTCGTTKEGDVVKAAGATSCAFAKVVYERALGATYSKWSPDPTVTSILRAEVTAASPATGDAYTLTCTVGSDWGVISCKKPDDSTVGVNISNTHSKIGNRLVQDQ